MATFNEKLLALARRLVRLDPRRGQTFMPRLVRQLAELFDTDRASILLLDLRKRRFSRATFTGVRIPHNRFNESNLTSFRVTETGKPIIASDIEREYPDLVGPFARTYKTGSFACFPMLIGDSVIGIISISNLKKTDQVLKSIKNIELLVGVITQIVSVLELPAEESPRSAARQIKTVREFAGEMESLDEADKMVHIYSETVFRNYNVIGLAVIVDFFGADEHAWIALDTPVSTEEVQNVLANITDVWREKTGSETKLGLSDATLLDPDRVLPGGGHLYSTSIKAFPIILDQKVSGIVGAAISSESGFSGDHLDLFNLITFQLVVSLRNLFLRTKHASSEMQDRLTGLFSGRHFDELFRKEFERCKRYKGNLGLLVIDVDHFKDINETYGQDEGDRLLSEIGRIIIANARSSDVLCRIRDDKFGALLPEANLKQAEMQAERLRNFISNYSFYSSKSKLFKKATVSVGIASFSDHKPESTEQLLEFADTALYFAKRNGRNRITSYSLVLNMLLSEGGKKA